MNTYEIEGRHRILDAAMRAAEAEAERLGAAFAAALAKYDRARGAVVDARSPQSAAAVADVAAVLGGPAAPVGPEYLRRRMRDAQDVAQAADDEVGRLRELLRPRRDEIGRDG